MANNTAISCRRYEENPGKDRSGDAGAGKEHVDLMRRRCVDVPDVMDTRERAYKCGESCVPPTALPCGRKDCRAHEVT